MIVGVGIDVVDVERFTRQLERVPALRDRLFTEAEKHLAPASLAARFAAKEAAAKALGAPGGAGLDRRHRPPARRRPAGARGHRHRRRPRRRARGRPVPPVAVATTPASPPPWWSRSATRDRGLRRRHRAGGRGAGDGRPAGGRADAAGRGGPGGRAGARAARPHRRRLRPPGGAARRARATTAATRSGPARGWLPAACRSRRCCTSGTVHAEGLRALRARRGSGAGGRRHATEAAAGAVHGADLAVDGLLGHRRRGQGCVSAAADARRGGDRRPGWWPSTCRAGSTPTPAATPGPHVRADVTVTFGVREALPAACRRRSAPPGEVRLVDLGLALAR